ncbi:MAG: hypothetical protein HYX87_08625 [Chloroflexi bacterium]|nr:hypothetical protein [Chloroflexota bacterium]
MTRSPYTRLGLILILCGSVLAPVFYFLVDSVPLAALAVSAIILGFVSAMLAGARPEVSPEACRIMLETGVENLAALLEELGLRSRAVYMPSSNGDRPRALIPLKEDGASPVGVSSLQGRLITRYGPNKDDMCLVVTTPGSFSLDGAIMDHRFGAENIEDVLNRILVGTMDLADSVSVEVEDRKIVAVVKKPKLKYENAWFHRCLGSPLASVVATVASQALAKPVRVESEEITKGGTKISVEVLG